MVHSKKRKNIYGCHDINVVIFLDDALNRVIRLGNSLSESQLQAVISNHRNVKIVAGAGAGKTEILTRRMLYLLTVKNVEPTSIVAFTFTDKAAQSMKSRLYQRIQQLDRQDLLRRFGEMYIGTIHGFYLRILQEKFDYGDYGVMDENQEMAFILKHGYEVGVNFKKWGGTYSDKCSLFLDTLSVVYSELMDRATLKEKEYDFFHSMEKYEKLLDRYRRLTYNYMGYLSVKKMRENAESTRFIKYLIVDEFQDINFSQYETIKLIGESSSLFVVGDPRQSIYQWRGSNESFFLNFSNDFPDTEEIWINENRRSGTRIIELSNKIASNFEGVDYEEMIDTRGETGELDVVSYENAKEEAEKIVSEIIEAKERGGNYSDFGVLFRSVNTSGQPIIDELRKRKIPYVVGGKLGLFKRDEAQALGRLFVWLHDGKGFWQLNSWNPNDKISGEDLVNTAIEFWKNAVNFNISDDIFEKLKSWKIRILSEEFSDYKEILSNLLVTLEYKRLNQDDPYDANIMANIGRFSTLLGDFESSNRYGGKDRNWNLLSELNSLCWYINTYATKAYEEQPSDDLSAIDAVNVMTIHQSKGLEWPTVFLPSMIKGRFPSSKSGSKKKWMISEDLFVSSRYKGGVEDEKRLFYVSVTRARDNLAISWFKNLSRRSSSASLFLDELDISSIEGTEFILKPHKSVPSSVEEATVYTTKDLIDYRRCPFHYRLSTQWSYSQGVSPFMGYGEALHSCLQRIGVLVRDGDIELIEATERAFREKFYLPFASPEFAEKQGKSFQESLIRFVKENSKDISNIEEVETRIEFPVENVTISGRADVIMSDGDALEVRDYKTSDKVMTIEDSRLQVQLYALGLSYLGRRISKGSVANINGGQVNSIGVTYADLEESKNTAKEIIGRIKDKKFSGKPGEFCKSCEYNGICKWSNQ